MPQIWIEPQQNSFLDTFAQAEQLKHYRSANALNDYKVQALEREAETAQRLREAYAGGADPMTDEGARQLMAAGADPKTIYGAQKERYAGEKNQSQTQGYDLDNALKEVEIGSQILSGVRDEGSYQWARRRAGAMKLGTEDWPANFDPNWVQQTQAAGMQLKDQLAHKLNEQKFAEEQKQSGIDNQFQQGNLDVSRGHLDVSRAGLEERRQYHQGMLNKPQSGFSMSYDAEGRPVVSYGPGAKPLTEGQSKATVNVTGAEVANTELSDLKEEGFDPTGASGGAHTWMAGKPGLNWIASEEGQRQHAANTGFAQAVNYQRSGAATPEVEYLRAVDSMMDRYGDKPAATEYKARMRNALVQAIAAGGGPQVDHIVSQILANNRATGGGAGSVSNRTYRDVGLLGGTGTNRTQKAPPPEPSSGLTPEEQAELDMLRRKFGR